MRPGTVVAICGVSEVVMKQEEAEFGATIGEKVFLIEFGDGESIEVAERWLEASTSDAAPVAREPRPRHRASSSCRPERRTDCALVIPFARD